MTIYKINFITIPALFFPSCLLPVEEQCREDLCKQFMGELLKVEGVQISKLRGGLSGAELFLAHTDEKNYVIRFLTKCPPEDREREILACRAASEKGYGPEVYLSDATQGFIIMEHLRNDPQPDDVCVALAKIVKKIHSSPLFPYNSNFFDEVNRKIDEYLKTKKAQMEFIPNDWLKKTICTLQEIERAVSHYSHTAPCHRDLHPANLLFSNNRFVAIDYEMMAQDDPFVDLAMITVSYCLNAQQEKLFLASYLDHNPSERETSKLFLMKQIVRIFWGLCLIAQISDEAPELQRPLSIRETFHASYRTAEGQLTNASIRLRSMLSDVNSMEYQQALQALLHDANPSGCNPL